MSWIYAFVERNENRYTKIGFAKDHYHERFSRTQQCNPIPMEIAGVWRFPKEEASKMFGNDLNRGTVFPRWPSGGREWFEVTYGDIIGDSGFSVLLSQYGGQYSSPEIFRGAFRETLNLDTTDKAGSAYKPHLYLICETSATGFCKIALSCYNWPTVVQHYMTYNPRCLEIVGRWTFVNEERAKELYQKLLFSLASRIANPLGWFHASPDEMTPIILRLGATPYPRASPIDDRVHYTRFRVPTL